MFCFLNKKIFIFLLSSLTVGLSMMSRDHFDFGDEKKYKLPDLESIGKMKVPYVESFVSIPKDLLVNNTFYANTSTPGLFRGCFKNKISKDFFSAKEVFIKIYEKDKNIIMEYEQFSKLSKQGVDLDMGSVAGRDGINKKFTLLNEFSGRLYLKGVLKEVYKDRLASQEGSSKTFSDSEVKISEVEKGSEFYADPKKVLSKVNGYTIVKFTLSESGIIQFGSFKKNASGKKVFYPKDLSDFNVKYDEKTRDLLKSRSLLHTVFSILKIDTNNNILYNLKFNNKNDIIDKIKQYTSLYFLIKKENGHFSIRFPSFFSFEYINTKIQKSRLLFPIIEATTTDPNIKFILKIVTGSIEIFSFNTPFFTSTPLHEDVPSLVYIDKLDSSMCPLDLHFFSI